MEQLFSQFADLPKLKKEQGDVLQLFKEVEDQIKRLSEAGLLIDGAKNLGQLSRGMKEFDAVLDKGAGALDKVGAAIQKNSKFTLSDIEAIKKAKGVTDEYVASLVKLAQSKQVYAEGHKKAGQQREKPMSGFQMYMGENMKGGKSHTQVSDEWTALDEQMKALWNYAAQFTKFGAVAEGVGASLDSAAQHAKEHAQVSQDATGDVKAHTEALKENTTAADDNATAADKWAKAIEAQKARAAGLVSGVSSEPVISRMGDSLGENATQRDNLKTQLEGIRQAKKELSTLNQGEFAGQFTEDINQLAEAEERLKIQIQQANRFVANQARELQANEGSLDSMRAKLNQMLQTYDAMGDAGKNTEGGRALNKQINDITVAIKEGEEGTDRYFRSVGKYAETLRPLFDKVGAQIEKLKTEQKELQAQGNGGVQNLTGPRPQVGFQIGAGEGPERLNQVTSQLQALETIQQAAAKSTGSYAQQVRVLDSALDEMARSGGSSVGFVLEMKEALQDAKIQNLGNFEGSAKIIVQAFEEARVKVKSLSQTMSESAPELQGARAELEALSRVVENPQFLNVAGKVGDATGEIKFFTKALNDMEAQGLKGSAVYQQVQKRLAELTDQIGDTRAEIKAMSSDTRSVDLAASGINTLISTYQTYIGVMAMAGANEEDLQKSMQKLLAVQNVANGVREIANELTQRGTLANKAYAYMQGLAATATNATAAATVRLGAALKLAGIGLLIGAVVLLVIQMQRLARATDEAGRRRKLLSDIERQAAQSYGQEKAQLDTLVTSLKTEGLTRKEKMQIIEELQSKYPGYFDNIRTEKDLNEKLAEAYEKASKGILLKAQAQAAGDRLAQNEQKRLEAELNLREKIAGTNEAERRQIAAPSTGNKADQITVIRREAMNSRKKFAQEYRETIAEIDEENEIIIASITNANNQIKALGGQVTGTEDKSKKSSKPTDASGDITKNAEEQRKILFEIRKRGIQDEIAALDDLSKAEKQSFQTRLLAAASLYEAKARLSAASKDFDLSEVGIREKQELDAAKKAELTQEQRAKLIASIQKKYAAERLNIESAYSSEVLKIQSETTAQIEDLQRAQTDKLKEDREKGAGDEYDRIQQNLYSHLQGVKEAADAELAIELEKYSRGESSKEAYERRKLDIETKARAASLKAEIAYHKALINISNLPEEKRKEALKKLYDLEERLRQENLKLEESAADEKWEINEQFYQKLEEFSYELKDMIASIMTGGIDREQDNIREQIDALEEKKNKEIEVVEQSERNEEQKALKIAKIEARAAAQKEALERRQRQLDLQRARFERADQVAGIIGNTAKGVAEALPNIPLSILVGAIGAAQLIKLLATPLPAYYTGTEASEEGYAQVAERGRELAVDPSGKLVLYEKPAVTYLKGGTKIYNNQQTEEILRESKAKEVPVHSLLSTSGPLSSYLKQPPITLEQVALDMHRAAESDRRAMITNIPADKTEKAVREMKGVLEQAVQELHELRALKSLLKDIKSRSGVTIYNQQGIESSAEFKRLMKE